MMRESSKAHHKLPEPPEPSLLRFTMWGAIIVGSVGLVHFIIGHVQYGFSAKMGSVPVQLTLELFFVLFLAVLGMIIGTLVGAVMRL